MWKAQQELSKRLGVIDNYKRDFKQMLIKLDNVEDARLLKETAMHQDDQQVSSMIRDLVVRLKEDLATMRKNIEEFGQNLALTLDEIERKKKEASAATAEKHKFYKDKIRGLEDIKREEEELSLKFKQAKDSLTAFSRKDKKSFGLREKEDQLKAALRDKGLAEQELKETKEEGEAFIKSSVVQVAEKRDTEAKNRDEAIEAFEAKKKEVTKNLKDLKHQIEQRKEKLPKF
jgi:chromosome segregation ATPase